MDNKLFQVGRAGVNAPSGLVAVLEANLGYMTKLKRKTVYGSDGAFCSRKTSLHLAIDFSVREKVSSASKFYFAGGSAVHEVIQNGLPKHMVVGNEIRVSFGKEIKINGYIDMLVVDPTNNCLKIVDIKTCGKLPTSIKPAHRAQLAFYMLATGIEKSSLLYFSRNVADYHGSLTATEIDFSFTPKQKLEYAQIMAEILVYGENKIIPPRPGYRATKSSCGFCPFKDFCWDDSPAYKIDHDWAYSDDVNKYQLEIEKVRDMIIRSQPKLYEKFLELIANKFGDSPGYKNFKQFMDKKEGVK